MKFILEIQKGNRKKFSITIGGIPGDPDYEQIVFADAGDEIPEILKNLGFMVVEYIKREANKGK